MRNRRTIKHRALRRLSAVAILPLLLAGCGEWPRFAHLPEDGGHPSSVDPSTLATVNWVFEVAEDPDLPDLPTDPAVARFTLEEGQGLEMFGTLRGGGWSMEKPPTMATSPECPDAEAPRVPAEGGGDYTKDLDIVLVDVPAGSTLCGVGRLDGAPATVGWDMGLVETLDCGVPRALVLDPIGNAVGFGFSADEGSWSVMLERDTTVAVLLGLFRPAGPDVVLDYHVGISVVSSAPNGPGVCPLLPGNNG